MSSRFFLCSIAISHFSTKRNPVPTAVYWSTIYFTLHCNMHSCAQQSSGSCYRQQQYMDGSSSIPPSSGTVSSSGNEQLDSENQNPPSEQMYTSSLSARTVHSPPAPNPINFNTLLLNKDQGLDFMFLFIAIFDFFFTLVRCAVQFWKDRNRHRREIKMLEDEHRILMQHQLSLFWGREVPGE